MARYNTRSFWLLTCSLGLLGLSSCDDREDALDGASGSGGASQGGSAQGGSSQTAGSAGMANAGKTSGGSDGMGGSGGSAPVGEGGAETGEAGQSNAESGAGGQTSEPMGEGGADAEGGAGGEAPTGPHQSPVLDYGFDEGAGTSVGDASGFELDGTLSEAAWTNDGRNGAAALLTGGAPPSKFVSVPQGVFDGAEEATIAAWVRLQSDAPWSRIFDFGNSGAGTDTRFMYLTPNTDQGMRFAYFGGAVENEAIITTGTRLPLGVWKHVAVTMAADGEHVFYIDGFPVAEAVTAAIPPSQLEPLSDASWLGKSRFPADAGLDGALDEFKVYDRVLSAAEIAALAAPKADYSRLPFDEGSGSTSADKSERGADATLTEGVTWASGRLGPAVMLAGTGQYVTLDNPIAGCTDQLTVALWVKHVAAANWSRIFDFGGTSDNFMFLTPHTDEGKLRLSIHNSSEETILVSGNTVPADSEWHHVAVVINTAAAKVYIDGNIAGEVADPVTPSELGATNEHWLGKSRFPDATFNGGFDELRVSCRAFTADEIRNLAFD